MSLISNSFWCAVGWRWAAVPFVRFAIASGGVPLHWRRRRWTRALIADPHYDPIGLWPEGASDPFKWERPDENGNFCYRVEIEGPIIDGDADKLEWVITENSYSPTRSFVLRSPGGNVLEAMTMGRLLRTIHADVSTDYFRSPSKDGDPKTCASACAIAYLGATQWNVGDRIGFHRPTLADLGDRDFANAETALSEVARLLRGYLQEMDANDAVYALMMSTEPDRLAAYRIDSPNPPFLKDWLTEQCKRQAVRWPEPPTEEDFEHCRRGDHGSLSRHDAEERAVKLDWFSYLPTKELERMRLSPFIGRIRQAAVRHELHRRDPSIWTAADD